MYDNLETIDYSPFIDNIIGNIPEDSQITYKDLALSSKRIGSEIYRKTNGQIRQPIVVFVDRNIESLVAFMAVAYSGNFYVPIDIQMPKMRVELILKTLQPLAMIVTNESKSFAEKATLGILKLDRVEETFSPTI